MLIFCKIIIQCISHIHILHLDMEFSSLVVGQRHFKARKLEQEEDRCLGKAFILGRGWVEYLSLGPAYC